MPRGLPSLFQDGSLTGMTDGQLLERFVAGDGTTSEAAFAALFDRHAPLVWRACRSVAGHDHDAADAFQATFLILSRKAGSLWARDSIAPWLHRVARRVAVHARRRASRRGLAEQTAAGMRATMSDPALLDDAAEILHHEIDRLPERHRVVIVLCDLEGRTCEEAARHLRRPVGTVKSRLSRARDRLRRALVRRGVAPSVLAMECLAAIDTPPRALAGSMIRGSLVSSTAAVIAKGVLKDMTRARIQAAVVLLLATTSVAVPTWFAFGRQQAGRAAGVKAPADRGGEALPAGDLEGNWIVSGGGSPFALIRIEQVDRQPRVRLVALAHPDFLDLAQSRVDTSYIDGRSVRFTLLVVDRTGRDRRPIDYVAYRPEGAARPRVLRGCWIEETRRAGRGMVSAVVLERTDRTVIDPRDAQKASAPGWEEFQQIHTTSLLEKRRQILTGILEKYADKPVAPYAASTLVLNQADAGAPEPEVRALFDQAVRIAGRNGRETEIGQIGLLVDNLVGAERLDGLVLEFARKAVAMLRPDDPVSLQAPTIKYLVAALRKSSRIDEQAARAEIKGLEDRLAALGRPVAGASGSVGRTGEGMREGDRIAWARTFGAARAQAQASGKRMLVAFVTQNSAESRRLEAEVLSRPVVVEAVRPFVPVKVDAEDGEGRPLAERYHFPLKTGYPIILILDPMIVDARDDRIVARLPGTVPPGSLADQLTLIARLPRDIDKLRAKAHPDDGEAMRLLAAALAMQGKEAEAAALIDRAWGPGVDRDFDRWAAVYNTLGMEAVMSVELDRAARWFGRASGVARRPIDVYNAHLGAGYTAMLRADIGSTVREWLAAGLVPGVSQDERAFVRELLGRFAKPVRGGAPVKEAAAAVERIERKSAGAREDKSPAGAK